MLSERRHHRRTFERAQGGTGLYAASYFGWWWYSTTEEVHVS